MTRLLEIKAIIVALYKRFDFVVNLLGKFIVALIILMRLNIFLGYSPALSKISINIAMAVMAAFLPGSWFLLLLLFVVSAQLFSASLEVMVIVTLLMIAVYLLFGRLQPKYSYFIIIVPLLASINMVYIVPLFAGLFFGPGTLIPVAVGLGVYQFAKYIPGLMDLRVEGATLFETPDIIMDMYGYLSNVLLNDKELILMILAFSSVIIIMYFVKKLQIDYIWYITIAVGALTYIVVYSIGNVVLNTQLPLLWPIIGTIVAAAIVAGMQFFKFSLDYKSAESLQFEDDDYYYYVKTIPKVKAVRTHKEIKRL